MIYSSPNDDIGLLAILIVFTLVWSVKYESSLDCLDKNKIPLKSDFLLTPIKPEDLANIKMDYHVFDQTLVFWTRQNELSRDIEDFRLYITDFLDFVENLLGSTDRTLRTNLMSEFSKYFPNRRLASIDEIKNEIRKFLNDELERMRGHYQRLFQNDERGGRFAVKLEKIKEQLGLLDTRISNLVQSRWEIFSYPTVVSALILGGAIVLAAYLVYKAISDASEITNQNFSLANELATDLIQNHVSQVSNTVNQIRDWVNRLRRSQYLVFFSSCSWYWFIVRRFHRR